jgi:hypothetical protein
MMLLVTARHQFSGFGLGGEAGDEETGTVEVFAAEGVGTRLGRTQGAGLAKSRQG